jgi:hypothetical protein
VLTDQDYSIKPSGLLVNYLLYIWSFVVNLKTIQIAKFNLEVEKNRVNKNKAEPRTP